MAFKINPTHLAIEIDQLTPEQAESLLSQITETHSAVELETLTRNPHGPLPCEISITHVAIEEDQLTRHQRITEMTKPLTTIAVRNRLMADETISTAARRTVALIVSECAKNWKQAAALLGITEHPLKTIKAELRKTNYVTSRRKRVSNRSTPAWTIIVTDDPGNQDRNHAESDKAELLKHLRVTGIDPSAQRIADHALDDE